MATASADCTTQLAILQSSYAALSTSAALKIAAASSSLQILINGAIDARQSLSSAKAAINTVQISASNAVVAASISENSIVQVVQSSASAAVDMANAKAGAVPTALKTITETLFVVIPGPTMASVAVDPSMSTVATPIVVGSSPGSMITRTPSASCQASRITPVIIALLVIIGTLSSLLVGMFIYLQHVLLKRKAPKRSVESVFPSISFPTKEWPIESPSGSVPGSPLPSPASSPTAVVGDSVYSQPMEEVPSEEIRPSSVKSFRPLPIIQVMRTKESGEPEITPEDLPSFEPTPAKSRQTSELFFIARDQFVPIHLPSDESDMEKSEIKRFSTINESERIDDTAQVKDGHGSGHPTHKLGNLKASGAIGAAL